MEDQASAAEAQGPATTEPVCEPGKVTVSLKPLDSRYIEVIRAWRNDYRINRWCRQNDLITDLAQRQWFERQHNDPKIRMYLVHCKTDHEESPVGVCGLTDIDLVSRRAEFSLYIAPELHGQKLGRHALNLLLATGFDDLGINVIWGESFDGNPAKHLFRKLGMTSEGIRRQFYFKEGRFIDAELFSITAAEWRARQEVPQ